MKSVEKLTVTIYNHKHDAWGLNYPVGISFDAGDEDLNDEIEIKETCNHFYFKNP
jgi:hypothetical protein